MKFTTALMSAAVLAASVSSAPTKRDVNPALVPQFGHAAGVNPTGEVSILLEVAGSNFTSIRAGTGDCDGAVNGANGQPIKVPCSCPPDRNTFIQVRNIPFLPTYCTHEHIY
jgi:hypothetical protein